MSDSSNFNSRDDACRSLNELADQLLSEKEAINQLRQTCITLIHRLAAIEDFDMDEDVKKVAIEHARWDAIYLDSALAVIDHGKVPLSNKPFYYDRRGNLYQWDDEYGSGWLKRGSLRKKSYNGHK